MSLVILDAPVVVFDSFLWVPSSVLSTAMSLIPCRTFEGLTSGEEILTPRMFDKMISSLSHIDSERMQLQLSVSGTPRIGPGRTEEDYVDPLILSLLRKLTPLDLRAIIRIVNNDLASPVKEVPDELLAPARDLRAERNRLGALLA